jgi:hypothetical protein
MWHSYTANDIMSVDQQLEKDSEVGIEIIIEKITSTETVLL